MAPATRRRAAAKTPVTATPSPNARGGKNPSAASPEDDSVDDSVDERDAIVRWRRRRRSGRLATLYVPRLPVFSSAFVFGLFALLAPIADRAYHALSTEGRMASDVPSFAHDLGKGFVVEWDKTLLELSVLHSRQDRKCASRRAASNVAEAQHRSECAPRVAWSTNPGLPFLVAANGPIRIHQLMAGHFKVDIRRVLQTTTQTLDSVEYVPPSRVDPVGTVIIRGVLIKDDARPDRMLSIVGDLRAAWNDMTHERLTFKAEAKLKASYTLTFTPASDARLAFEFEWDDEVPGVMRSPGGRRKSVGLNQVILRYASDKHERIYGMGEQYSSLEHKGKRIPIITAEQGIGRGKQPVTFAFNRVFMGSGGNWHTTYTAIPHYVTSAARSVFLTNYSYAEFDFTDDETISILSTTPTNTLCGQIIGARSIPETVAAYTEYSGRMEPLPEWAYANGVILGMTGGSAKVRKVASMLRDAGVPLAGLWLQDWGGIRNTSIGIERVWWNWELDESNYPDWHALREEAAMNGTRLLTYTNPFLMDARGPKGRLYREAKEAGYMVQTVAGGVYRLGHEPGVSFGLLDLTNPAAVRWIEDVLHDMLKNTGAVGWMADFGEYLPFDCVLHSGEAPIAVHNRYPEDWAALNRRAMIRAGLGSKNEGGNGEGMFYSRSASSQTPRHTPLMWLGDQLVSWDAHDGMKSAVLGMLQGGLSGLALSHSDIGGYTATPGRHRTRELLMRWMELSALSDVVFRTHQGNRPLHNAQPWDTPELLDHLRDFARLHRALAPYRAELMRESSLTGMPLTRPLFMHYPHDVVASRVATQFLVGRDILAAPVMDRKTSRVHVYLPPGDTWLDVWTTQQAPAQPTGPRHGHGVWLTVDAPMGWPAVFIRADAGKPATRAAAPMREWAAERGGLPPHRHVAPMDPVEKLVLGLYV
jgi:sulfoquinovosidase